MIKMNDRMKDYLSQRPYYTSEPLVEEVLSKMNTIKLIWDCTVNDLLNNRSEATISEEKIYKIYMDKTGYEADLNEIMLTVPKGYTAPIFDISSAMMDRLKQQFPDRVFCVVISVDKEFVCARFHTVRENEMFWCSQDLDGFKQPVFEEIK